MTSHIKRISSNGKSRKMKRQVCFCLYLGRTFLWRHTPGHHHLHWQSAVGWVQEQQQLGGKRFLSCLWRYSSDDALNLLFRDFSSFSFHCTKTDCDDSFLQRSVGARWSGTVDKSSPPIIPMTTSPTKCVCGKSQWRRDLMLASPFNHLM